MARTPRKPGAKTGNNAIPFDGEKPKYEKRELEFNTRFNERLTNYATHYKEVKGVDCDLGILIGNIVDIALNDDGGFVTKENSGYFNASSDNGARPASHSAAATRPTE